MGHVGILIWAVGTLMLPSPPVHVAVVHQQVAALWAKRD
jgi:hypothetical protein